MATQPTDRAWTGRLMAAPFHPPVGVKVHADVEVRRGVEGDSFRARVRWYDPASRSRRSKSETFPTESGANSWIDRMRLAAAGGIDPIRFTQTLREYADANMSLALRGLEAKTTDPYLAGWRHRVVPTLGQLTLQMITYGAVDRAVHGWVADNCSRSTVENSLAVLVRVMEQAVRDGLIDRNPARITGS